MEERQRLLLAVGIAEWASTLASLDAMDRQGLVIPADVVRSIGRELTVLIGRWPAPPGTPVEKVVADARRYVTEHASETDVLLDRMRTQ